MSDPTKAVFLSYAREDTDAAKRIAEALRGFGVEVWFDQSELRGGDQWDAKIRTQIKACALFIPIVSATTQSRDEGYFRLEWKLADDRSHLMAPGKAFIVPVVIDDTPDTGTAVPDSFGRAQWTRLSGGEPTPAFIEQVKRLLEIPKKPARKPDLPRPPTLPPEFKQSAQKTEGRGQKTEDGRAGRNPAVPGWMWGVLATVLIVVGAGAMLLRKPVPPAAPSQTAPTSDHPAPDSSRTATSSDKSVAVLAFSNLSEDKANEYFSDGISEELLNVLAKVPGLKVSARTSAFYFKGKEVPVPEIARQLGVAYVVEGSVRKQGDKVRITAQLIKAADGFHVWSDTFTRDMKDIFAVQDEIAGLIAKTLELKMGIGSPESRREVDPEAHRLVLEGRHFLAPRTAAGFEQAERAFTAALKIDPQFAQAQAGLASTTALRGRYRLLDGVGRVEEFDQLALAQSRRALQMDPTLAEPHATIGFVYTDIGRLAEAEQEFQMAFAANPNFATAYHWHSHVLAAQGRLDLALQEIGRAEALDPVSFIILFIRGFYLCDARRYAEALAVLDRAAAIRGESFLPLESDRARVLLALGRRDEALAVARKILQDPRLIGSGWYAAGEALYVLHSGGAADEATRLASAILQAMPAGSYQRGYVLCAIGRFTEGMQALALIPDIVRSRLYWHPMLEPVRDKPEFRQMLENFHTVSEYKVARETLARMLKEQEAKK